jgi:hypothetical protein
VVDVPSSFNVEETADRLVEILNKKGMTIEPLAKGLI